ncbi:ABC transporter permease [Myxococcus sp. K38C18041901]|uniref:ABC transporter permease n=1 Tax=Myxococcus guangdongensis TaxID=2906760 RepID=UPI0020A729DA|nr:ABC transporter permease [Myxococcus guangdongensis]MCP3065053.1 ABC transporter permease [Myxococcus guangdongensis]
METFLQDVKYALRGLRNSPGFTLMAVWALALGIGANSAVFSVVNGVLLRPLPFHQPEQLVRLYGNLAGWDLKDITSSVPEYQAYRQQLRAFSSVGAYVQGDMTLTGRDAPQRLTVTKATASFAPTLGLTPSMGRWFTDAEETPGKDRVVVLTQGAWRAYFAQSRDVLGRSLQLDGEAYTVVGVLPAGGLYPEDIDLYLPLAPPAEHFTENYRGARYLSVLGRLKPGMTEEAALRDMAQVAARESEAHPQHYKDAGWSLSLKTLEERTVGSVRGTLWMLLGAVGFVLLVACSSVANLLLARAVARGREVAIRAALGASRKRLVAQFLTESLMLSVAGGLLGVLLAAWGLEALLALVGDGLPRATEVQLDTSSLLFTGGVSLLTGLLFGLVPALRSSRADLASTMNQGARGTVDGGTSRLRGGFVVAQVALALVLLVGAALFGRSFLALRRVDPGFAADGVLAGWVSLPQAGYGEKARQADFQRALLERVQALPDVEAVGLTNLLPLSGQRDNTFDIEGRTLDPSARLPAVQYRAVTAGYFQALRVKLHQGRMLRDTDDAGSPWALVINQRFADLYWPRGDAMGQRLKMHTKDAQWATVVGIVEDLREANLSEPARPTAYWSLAQLPALHMGMVVRPRHGAPESVRASLESMLREVDREVPLFGVAPLSQRVDDALGSRRMSALLMGLFAGVSLLLAALGIAGVIAYSVAQRTRELGIRMALGADRSDVLRLVLGQGMRLAVVGVGAGLVLSVGLALGLEQVWGPMLYEVTAKDPWTFIGVAGLLGGVALVATWVPAMKATRVDPIVALRAE